MGADGRLAPAPIGEPGSWQVASYPGAPWWARKIPIYFAVSFARATDGRHWHAHIGLRWDDVDGYSTLSVMRRRYNADGETDTSTTK